MKNMKKNNSIFKTLAELVYNKAIREDIEKRITDKYEKRIEYLVGANNELMKELEQWERVGKRLEKSTYGPKDFDNSAEIQYHGKTKNYKKQQKKENNDNDKKD